MQGIKRVAAIADEITREFGRKVGSLALRHGNLRW